ncbi:hypothetical protein BpHYR1_022135 [Brachionus plicatilis]|uniref:Uncharacterized protein n=1 Tax=Brachionus plicatilis TaxID=10195 RepID=A0A3M7P7Q5_BRAPC|nr:hypothetical protein BpHYR1_022135 [Brachionus plicatilis]
MKNKNILIDQELSDTDLDFDCIDYSVTKSELNSIFNKLVKKLMNKYEIYLKSCQRNNVQEIEDNESTKISDELENLENKSSDSKIDEFDGLLKFFDKLIEFLLTLRQQNSFVLLTIFQKTNLIVIHLVEFLNKLLNNFYQTNEFNNAYKSFSSQFDQNSKVAEFNACIIGKTIQLLHVITNQHQNNDDESTTYCCDLITNSFNFTSSIANLILVNAAPDQKPILNEQYSKACLDLMNNLTFNNRLFAIDVYIKKFIFYLIDRIVKSDLRPNYFQFLSNILRNEELEISKIFKSMDDSITRKLYRQLISIIKENTNGLVLLSLIILIKLEYSDLFAIVLPIKQKTNSIYEPIDCAMSALNELNINKKMNSSLQRLNALNFLYEFVKCEPVKCLLEGNEDYIDVLMFRLNQLLVLSLPESQFPLNISTKIIKLFNQLILSSDKFAKKQFRIIFDTKNFVESGSNKLRDLALSTKIKSNISEYKYIIEYFFKILEIKNGDKSEEEGEFLTRNSSFYSIFLAHMLNLFKKNEYFDFEIDVNDMSKLMAVLIKNFYHISTFYADQNNCTDSITEANIDKISFFNMGLIDSILRSINSVDHKLEKFSNFLVDSIEQNIWQKENYSMESELSFGNYMAACKILTRLFLSKKLSLDSQIQKERANNLIKDNRLTKAVSYLTSKSTEFMHRLMAYEFLFDFEALSNELSQNRSFFLNAIVRSGLKLSSDPLLTTQGLNEIKHSFLGTEKKNEVPLRNRDIDKGDLENLFDFYDFKINEKIRQETHLINTLNQYVYNSLLKEAEFKTLRDQIRIYAQKEARLRKDLEILQKKNSEFELKYKDMIKLKDNLERENENMKEICVKLASEKDNFKEKCANLEKQIEQVEKDNEETVVSLQQLIEKEASVKKELHSKLKDSLQKISDLEQSRNTIDAKKKDLEAKLEQMESEFGDKNAQFDAMKKEYDTMKSDHDRLKGILSYVKENYK